MSSFGDSARDERKDYLKPGLSPHVFDGAGENVNYHSDSESSSKTKARYINPAICIETIESSHSVTSLHTDSTSFEEVTPHPHGSYRSSSTPFLTGRASSSSSSSVKRKSCRLLSNDDDEETPRFNGRTYREENPDTFRLSVVSCSTTTTARQERERSEQKKEEAFKRWLEKKEQEKREKLRQEKQKQQQLSAPCISAQKREESYRGWLERKRRQDEARRADELMRKFREEEKLKEDQMKRDRAKEEKLADWIRKKEEEMKAMKTQEERKAARQAIEEERRRVKGEKAYQEWLRSSKHKPLPVPLNQGELITEQISSPLSKQNPNSETQLKDKMCSYAKKCING